jgi:hypothetical protein
MKKIFSIALALFFVTVGVAMATDFSMTGNYYVRGQIHSNPTGLTDNTTAYGIYDHDFDLTTVWQIADTTKVTGVWEARDASWVAGDQFDLDRIWGQHTFGNGGTIHAGIMSGGAWATAFGDSEGAAYRVKYVQPVAFGAVIGLVQKIVESGNIARDDFDVYALGILTKLGDINVKPLFVYSDNLAANSNTKSLDVGFDGAMDAVSFEAEVNIDNIDPGVLVDSYTVWGIYGKVSFTSGPLTIGILGEYGTWDDDAGAGYQDGADMCAGGATFLGCDWEFDAVDNDMIIAPRVIALTLSYAASEQLSLSGYAGYATTGIDDNGRFDGATMWEISGGAAYAITDAVTYSVGAAFARFDVTAEDTVRGINLYHKLNFSF